MSDIVERLRAGEWGADVEAADEIERLEAYGKLQREAFEAEVRINSIHTAEIERLRKEVDRWQCKWFTSRSRVRAETIEECALEMFNRFGAAACDAIRALKEQK